MRTFGRRLVSLTVVFLALPLLILLTPIAVVVAVVVDLIGGLRKLPTVRLWFFAVVFLAYEWIGQARAFGLWLRGGFGRNLDHDRHRRVQAWWTGSLLTWARRLLNVRLDVADPASLPPGEMLVFSRHASMVDALLPAYIFATQMDRSCHYIMKKELRWLPNIDVYGDRLGNYFVDRAGKREAEVAEIGKLAEAARPGSALVIFPEGTYANPAAKARVQRSLERNGDHRGLALNAELEILLPPRPAGSMRLLADRPDAPVVVVGHVGLEGLAELSGLRRNLPATEPVIVRWWVTERRHIDDGLQWIDDQWRLLDQWVGEQLNSRRQ